jgi:hypothetical protein
MTRRRQEAATGPAAGGRTPAVSYNWDGDIIVQDCAVEKKRYVIGSRKPITTDIREFVSSADDAIIKGILAQLASKPGRPLPRSKMPGEFDERARIIWDYVARSVAYRPDAKRAHGEFWFFPSEVHTLAYGDCEDGSILLASLLIGSGISPFNVRIALGELLAGEGRSLGGHCWPMYKDEAGHWCILESTFDRAPCSLPTADRFTGPGDVRYVPHFCFNNFHLWSIRHERQPKASIQRYLQGPERLANLKNPRFPSGGWLSALAGDHSPGHWELTRDALKEIGFSADAVSVAADAAQDPDFYEWNNPAAHAQTACDPDTGATTQVNDVAIAAFRAWFETRKGQFVQAGKDSHALFFLGYLLHGIQDLASHQGVTNAQHAYDSYVLHPNGDDCDHLEANRDTARAFVAQLLPRLRARNPAFFERMTAYDAGFHLFDAKLAAGEKCVLLGKAHWDFTVSAYRRYKGLAKKYQKVQEANPVRRWDAMAVFAQVLASM